MVEESISAHQAKIKIFISYFRKDIKFAEKLGYVLNSLHFEAYLDKKDIAPGEPWKKRLGATHPRSRHRCIHYKP